MLLSKEIYTITAKAQGPLLRSQEVEKLQKSEENGD